MMQFGDSVQRVGHPLPPFFNFTAARPRWIRLIRDRGGAVNNVNGHATSKRSKLLCLQLLTLLEARQD
jgi:hypothetical protein